MELTNIFYILLAAMDVNLSQICANILLFFNIFEVVVLVYRLG